jgi:phosphoglycolate phosphatase-like HAD superfamily hydrolase
VPELDIPLEPLTPAEGADGGGPKRDILARAIAAADLPAQQIIFIGDNLNDVEAGLGNGVTFIGFSEDEARRRKLATAGARQVCANHDETLALIRQHMKG